MKKVLLPRALVLSFRSTVISSWWNGGNKRICALEPWGQIASMPGENILVAVEK